MKCDYCDDLRSLAALVCNGLSYPSKRARLVCLRFTAILLTHSPAASARAQLPLSLFRSSLLSATKDGHDEVIEAAVEVLLQYARRLDDLPGVLRDVMEVAVRRGLKGRCSASRPPSWSGAGRSSCACCAGTRTRPPCTTPSPPS